MSQKEKIDQELADKFKEGVLKISKSFDDCRHDYEIIQVKEDCLLLECSQCGYICEEY